MIIQHNHLTMWELDRRECVDVTARIVQGKWVVLLVVVDDTRQGTMNCFIKEDDLSGDCDFKDRDNILQRHDFTSQIKLRLKCEWKVMLKELTIPWEEHKYSWLRWSLVYQSRHSRYCMWTKDREWFNCEMILDWKMLCLLHCRFWNDRDTKRRGQIDNTNDVLINEVLCQDVL